MKPLALAPNLIDHFYRGGDRIAALRGIEQTSEFQPEEWLGSTVSRAGEGDSGLASTVDGDLLRDLVSTDPAGWIGADHAPASSISDVGLLVKLLDARQRLPVHVHPERAFAVSHLNCPYGKTEAWLVLDAEPGAAVYVGWNTAIDSAELEHRMEVQDSEWMLAHLNRVEVQARHGDPRARRDGPRHRRRDLRRRGAGTDRLLHPARMVGHDSSRDDSHLGLGFRHRASRGVDGGAPASRRSSDRLRSTTSTAARRRRSACFPPVQTRIFGSTTSRRRRHPLLRSMLGSRLCWCSTAMAASRVMAKSTSQRARCSRSRGVRSMDGSGISAAARRNAGVRMAGECGARRDSITRRRRLRRPWSTAPESPALLTGRREQCR